MLRQARLDWQQVGSRLADAGTVWRFILPRAPHFGGLWEAAVKTHLRKIIGQQVLIYEEMATLTAQIEMCLNSQPLVPITGDPDDIDSLTPGHYLIGSALNAIPDSYGEDNDNLDKLNHWRLVKAIRDRFWVRWSWEYLNTLSQHHKWYDLATIYKSTTSC